MKATGIIRKVDELGRVVIPMELRKSLGIKEGNPLEIYTDENNQIIFKQYQPGCQECGSVDVSLHGDKIKLCVTCIQQLKSFVDQK